ncbi:DUF58 domain-containing protein [Deminuibacter soli]|uniref:DUF58 domain-containing protein n=1 Tax=Deminuibacter soli TaxID=2291815 RepID=A0A3E1NHA6_9BACT|nr:DUF58 domain-containing protein [Deminuibacter soli]RFM27315.1 DUF58 domain-containing protein [Deminuibacter soli]
MKHPAAHNYPPEVVTSMSDLMRFEYLVQARHLLPGHTVFSLLTGTHTSKLRGRGLDFEEVRRYVYGDDIRNIDWRVTAKTGTTHSKVFNEEKERPTFIVLDQSSAMFFGSKRYVKSVSAAHVAAISAFYTLKRGDRAGGIIFNESHYDYVPPKRNKALVQHYLKCIVAQNALLPQRKQVQRDPHLLNNMLQVTRSLVTHDYVIPVIGDFSAMDATTRRHLLALSNHNDVILIHVYDPFEQALPDGRLVLTDGKKQLTWNNKKRHAGKLFAAHFREMQTAMTAEFRHYGIPVVFFSTEYAIEDQVSHHFKQ